MNDPSSHPYPSVMNSRLVINTVTTSATVFYFRPEITLSGQIWYKNKNCQFQLKFDAYTKFEYAEFAGDIHFSCFRPEIPFFSKFGPKNTTVISGWKIWSKKSKLSVYAETCYLD